MISRRDGTPPGVNRVVKRRRDGAATTYYYWRATGARLHGEPGTPEFAASLAQAQSPRRKDPAKRPTFAALADDFELSWEHKKAVRTTRHARETVLGEARKRFHWVLLDDLNRRAIRDEFMRWRDEMVATPRKADLYMSVLSRLLSWAYDRGLVDYNHGLRIGKLTPSGHSRREHVWTPEHEKIILAKAKPEIVRLYLFALYSAAREADLASMRRDAFDGKWLVFTPAKTRHSTKVAVALPVYALPPFAALMAELPQRTEFLLTTDGRKQRWSATNIRARWRREMGKIGLGGEDLHFHDIRGTAASRMLAAGATEAEVAAVTGHAIGAASKLRDYAQRSRALALGAYTKWARAMAGEDGPAPALQVVG